MQQSFKNLPCKSILGVVTSPQRSCAAELGQPCAAQGRVGRTDPTRQFSCSLSSRNSPIKSDSHPTAGNLIHDTTVVIQDTPLVLPKNRAPPTAAVLLLPP